MTRVLLMAAMAEETAPVLDGRDAVELDVVRGPAWQFDEAGREVTVVTSGIGLVNAAASTALAIEAHRPDAVVSIGSAGGLGADVGVGDIVVGATYRYSDADSTAFGYEYGQVPASPPAFGGDPRLLALLREELRDVTVHVGEIVSGNSFVDARLAPTVQGRFPAALAADMESTAIAQVAAQMGVPFVCVRSISDLCGPSAASDFEGSLADVAERSVAAVRRLIAHL